tara:strand:- start:583 stop:750 length:168 start_codon:yes stop_codon:yes gene_type:complete
MKQFYWNEDDVYYEIADGEETLWEDEQYDTATESDWECENWDWTEEAEYEDEIDF